MQELKANGTDKLIIIDDEDFNRINQFEWTYFNGWISRYVPLKARRTLANEILQIEGLVDHKDRNPLNNSKTNLRLADNTLNAANRPKANMITSSKYKGVSLNKGGKTWRARIRFYSELISLGSFKTQEEAAIAYNEAAIKYFGEFALLNTVPEGSRGGRSDCKLSTRR